jgi:uncharacterized membrane protein
LAGRSLGEERQSMEMGLDAIVEYTARAIEFFGMLIIAHASVRTAYTYVREGLLHRSESCVPELRTSFARHLVLALEFALAGDIVQTIVSPTLEKVGLLAAIAALRTFLNFFLERELAIMDQRTEHTKQCPPTKPLVGE